MKSHKTIFNLINGITMYRLFSAPFILILAFTGHITLFKWLIAVSFLTDAIDGPLSRKYKVTSIFGSRLDSVADDATVIVSTIALWLIRPEFVIARWVPITCLLILFVMQTGLALIVYKKVTSFHTYMAKAAAIFQGLFFVSVFFEAGPTELLFYAAVVVTAIELVEELVLVILLPEWKANVKGLYWVLRSRGAAGSSGHTL